MVCAFVTNQLLHEQTSPPSSSSSSSSSSANDATAADLGLVPSLVDALNAVDSYQRSTSQARSLHTFTLFLILIIMYCSTVYASWLIYARALLEYVNFIVWVYSVNKMLPSVKFAEYKVLTFLILCEKC